MHKMRLDFACGCFAIYYVSGDGMQTGLACCALHEAPYQQIGAILPLTLVKVGHSHDPEFIVISKQENVKAEDTTHSEDEKREISY